MKRVHAGAGSPRRALPRRPGCLEHSRPGDEAGVGLIEVLVALTVLTVVLLTVERGTIATLSAESLAKEHSVATTLVSAKIAQAESRSFPALKAGLNPSVDPLSQDPNISSVTTSRGTSYVFIPTGATLATSGTATSEPPIIPHISTVNIGIPYDVAVYPTISSTDPGVVTITVTDFGLGTGPNNLGRHHKTHARQMGCDYQIHLNRQILVGDGGVALWGV